MAEVKPDTWISGWDVPEYSTDVTFPIASVPYLTEVEADGATGDFRKVMFALCEHTYNTYRQLATADKPTKMVITKSSTLNTETNVTTNTYTFRFFTQVADEEVVAEA